MRPCRCLVKRAPLSAREILAFLILALMGGTVAAQQSASQYFQTRPMPQGREKHAAAVIGDYIYVISGETLDQSGAPVFTPSTLFAPIQPDGNIGQWRETTPLPAPLAYIGNSTVARGRVIYVAGGSVRVPGQDSGIASRVVTMAAQREDGTLSRWLPSDPFPGPALLAGAAAATDSHLYVMGGASTGGDGDIPQRVVYIAPFIEGGLLGPWMRGPDLPQPLWFVMAGIAGDHLYVWGGTNSSPSGSPGAVDTTYAAQIYPDGALGAWSQVARLPQPTYFSAAASIDETLYNFSGRFRDGTFTNDVLFAIPAPDEGFAWTRVRANVPLFRYLAPAVDHRRGIIFFPGGRYDTETRAIRDVYGYRIPRVEEEVADVFQVGTPTPPTQPPVQPLQPVQPTQPIATPGSGGWLDYSEGEVQALRTNRNMLLFFTTPQARMGREIEENIFSSPDFDPVAQSHVLVHINAAEERRLAVTYGVYRVPTVVIVSPRGQVLRSFVRDVTLSDLRSAP